MTEICKCKTKLNNISKEQQNSDGYIYTFTNLLCKFEYVLYSPYNITLELLCDHYIINDRKYIKKCCYEKIIFNIKADLLKFTINNELEDFEDIFNTDTLDISNYIEVIYNDDYKFFTYETKLLLNGQKINLPIYINDDNKLEKEFDILKNKYNNIHMLNQRLINTLKLYKYHEFNTIEKYDYEEIKQKNKKLNQEFKRIAKLMKLCN